MSPPSDGEFVADSEQSESDNMDVKDEEYEYESESESESGFTGSCREIQNEENLHIGHVESTSESDGVVDDSDIVNDNCRPGEDMGITELREDSSDLIKDFALYPVRGVVQQIPFFRSMRSNTILGGYRDRSLRDTVYEELNGRERTSTEDRLTILQNDPNVLHLEDHYATCRGCLRKIKLTQRETQYTLKTWLQHAFICDKLQSILRAEKPEFALPKSKPVSQRRCVSSTSLRECRYEELRGDPPIHAAETYQVFCSCCLEWIKPHKGVKYQTTLLQHHQIHERPRNGTRGIRNAGGGDPSRKRRIDAIDRNPVDILCPPRKIRVTDNSQTIDGLFSRVWKKIKLW